jgi:tetratricopeptide (TPR) repeat protein
MKPMTKSYVILSLIVLGIASCSPVTPMTTESPMPSAVPSATSVPLFVALPPSNGPDKDISSYRLRTWTEEDYTRIVENLDDWVREGEEQTLYWALPDSRIAFRLEHLLKFPASTNRDEILWEILLNNPGTISIPGEPIGNDLMSSLISEWLAQNVQPADLSEELINRGMQVDDTLTVHNLIGNGEDGLVLLIGMHGFENVTGVFVVLREGKEFHVEKIRDWEVSDWVGMGRYFEIYDMGDTNGNGLPEIVVQVQTGVSGIPQTWKEHLDQIEWSPQNKIFQSRSFPVFWQDCDWGPCEGDWEFSKIDSQSVLTTKSYWSTRESCPDLTIQRVFVWNGTQYASGNTEVVPPGEDLSAECRLAWAETAIGMPVSFWDNGITEPGWKDDRAISIIEKSLNDWPAGADEIWGPASRDYFKLHLGILYELRNEAGKAKSALQQVANKAYDPKYDFASRLAALYLQTRAGSGRVRACLDLENAYLEEFRKTIPEPSPFNNDEALLAAWGTVDGVAPSCDAYDMLATDVKDARLISPEALTHWLEKNELTVYHTTSIDLNNDGADDYVILLDTLDAESSDAWAFFATPTGYQADYIGEMWLEDGQSKLDLQSVEMGDNTLAHVIFSAGDLIILRVSPDLNIEVLAEQYSVQSFEIDETLASISVEIDSDYEGKSTVVYLWDSSPQRFPEQADGFTDVEVEVEKLLFAQGNYQGAIDYIDGFLQVAPEPRDRSYCGVGDPENCVYPPAWNVPYLHYLRGLACEQLGQKEQAVQAYFDLWRDFPRNVFGMAASLKLEPVNP